MQKKIFIIFLLFLCLSVSVCSELKKDDLNLDGTIKLALLNNRELLSAQHDIEIADSRLKEAISLSYPQIDLTGNYSVYNLDSKIYSVPSRFGDAILYQEDKNFYMARVSLYQFLYAGRRHYTARKSSKVGQRRAQMQYRKIRNEVVFNTKVSFYENLLYFEQEKFLKQELNKNDLARDYKRFLDDKIGYITLKKQISRLDLLKVVGLDLNSLIAIDGEFLPLDKPDYDVKTCIARGLELRPELMESQAQEEISSLEMAIAVAEKNPVVLLGASYEMNTSYGEDEEFSWKSEYWDRDWTVSLTFNLPIFDGGAGFARSKQKRSNVRKIQIERAELESNIELEIEKAFLLYNYWQKKLEDAGDIQNLYDSINGKNLDLKTRENIVENILAWFDTLYNYNKAVLTLKYSMGELE